MSIRNYVESRPSHLSNLNKTLSQEQQFTPIWKTVHIAPFLYDRYTSELFSKNDENPLLLRSDYPRIVQESNWSQKNRSQKNNANI